MNKIIRHFKLWNEWRKNCLNKPFYKVMVLLGICYSPTFSQFKSIKEVQLSHPELTIRFCDGKLYERRKNVQKPKKFIQKILVKIAFIIILLTIAFSLIDSPVLTNEMALIQMQINSESFMIWEIFNKIRPIIRIILCIIGGWMMYNVTMDIYKYAKDYESFKKSIDSKEEKEI